MQLAPGVRLQKKLLASYQRGRLRIAEDWTRATLLWLVDEVGLPQQRNRNLRWSDETAGQLY